MISSVSSSMPVSLLTDRAATSPASPASPSPGVLAASRCANPSAVSPLERSEGSDVRLDPA